ncbi:MAG: hypothetical protein AAGN35_16215 [Bacteroidota bacterium]
MKRILLPLLLLLGLPLFSLAQNVGIGITTPMEKLHVDGSVRSNALASADTNVVVSDVNGTLINLAPGNSGQVLLSQGAGRAPQWGALSGASGTVEAYGVFATRTSITSTVFTPVNGLSQTITLTAPAIVTLSTYGSMETFSTFWGGSGCIVQVFQNNVAVTNAFQTVDIQDATGFFGTISPWGFTVPLTLPAGTYTFDVRARKYAFDNFYAGGNTTAPNPNEGALTILVIYQ